MVMWRQRLFYELITIDIADVLSTGYTSEHPVLIVLFNTLRYPYYYRCYHRWKLRRHSVGKRCDTMVNLSLNYKTLSLFPTSDIFDITILCRGRKQ